MRDLNYEKNEWVSLTHLELRVVVVAKHNFRLVKIVIINLTLK